MLINSLSRFWLFLKSSPKVAICQSSQSKILFAKMATNRKIWQHCFFRSHCILMLVKIRWTYSASFRTHASISWKKFKNFVKKLFNLNYIHDMTSLENRKRVGHFEKAVFCGLVNNTTVTIWIPDWSSFKIVKLCLIVKC